MGNKTPPPVARRPPASSMTISGQNGAGQSSGSISSQQQVLLRCPACTRTVRPPPGAQRFRCPCGRILAHPSANVGASSNLTSSHGSMHSETLQSNTRSIPPQVTPPAPLPSATRTIPPQQPSVQPQGAPMRVRCPSCQQILLAPNARKYIAKSCEA